MLDLAHPAAIVVDEKSVASDSTYDVVQSNFDVVNMLLREYYLPNELSQDAMRSYCVDYFHAQMINGGFAQFVKNSRWRTQNVLLTREGLVAMGAVAHSALFEEGVALVKSLGDARLERFVASTIQSYGSSTELSVLRTIDDRFNELDHRQSLGNSEAAPRFSLLSNLFRVRSGQAKEHSEVELRRDQNRNGARQRSSLPDAPNRRDTLGFSSLRMLHRTWLKGHPNLVPASLEKIRAEVQRRAEFVPNRAERIAQAEANAPRYYKLIRALAAKAGQTLKRVTVGDPNRLFAGEKVVAWYFLTDQGVFHMVDSGGKAIMFRGQSTTDQVCEIEAP